MTEYTHTNKQARCLHLAIHDTVLVSHEYSRESIHQVYKRRVLFLLSFSLPSSYERPCICVCVGWLVFVIISMRRTRFLYRRSRLYFDFVFIRFRCHRLQFTSARVVGVLCTDLEYSHFQYSLGYRMKRMRAIDEYALHAPFYPHFLEETIETNVEQWVQRLSRCA